MVIRFFDNDFRTADCKRFGLQDKFKLLPFTDQNQARFSRQFSRSNGLHGFRHPNGTLARQHLPAPFAPRAFQLHGTREHQCDFRLVF